MDDFSKGEQQPEYDLEQGRRREPLFNIPAVVLIILAIATLIQLLISYVFDANMVDIVYYYGGFIPARYGGQIEGEWLSAVLSPITYAFLHGGWEHLIFNGVWLAAFGTPVALRLGSSRFILFWIITSIISAFTFDIANYGSTALLVGASGAISGLTGADCRFVWSARGLRMPHQHQMAPSLSIMEAVTNRQVMIFAGFWIFANVILAAGGIGAPGVDQAVAWQAHLGGFLAGFFLFPLFDPKRSQGSGVSFEQ